MSGSCAVEPREADESQTDVRQISVHDNVETGTDSVKPTPDETVSK